MPYPVSSRNSRRRACKAVSPGSSPPPGISNPSPVSIVTDRSAPRQSGSDFVLGDGQWFPVPRQELVEPGDDVVVDTGEDVREVALRIDVGQLGTFDDRHRISQGFSAGIGSGKEKILAPECNTTQGPLSGIVVDGDPAVLEK